MSGTFSRAGIEAELDQVMGIFTTGMKTSITGVFDAGVKNGRETAMREVGFTVETLKANLHNNNLSDTDFRRFVVTIVERLSEQLAA